MHLELRDYQKECLEIIDNLQPGSYLIQMATGRSDSLCRHLLFARYLYG